MGLVDEVRTTRSLPPPAAARRIRVLAGVTQERMAREVGVHRVTLARWEAGDATPRGASRVQYAELLAELQEALAS
jgi:DNA-binding XRE family transcriptional regulator